MVPQLHKFLRFKSIQGDKNDCTLFNPTPRNAISFRHVSSCGTIENHLTIFKERHHQMKNVWMEFSILSQEEETEY